MEQRKYDSNELEALWTELKLCSQRLIMGTVYRLPDQANVYELIPPVLEKIWATRSNILITGDLNSDLTPDYENNKGRKFDCILTNFDLKNAINSQRLIIGTVYRLPDQANVYELIPPVLEKT